MAQQQPPRKTSLTLYFFPAFLPLAPLIPFVLSAVGALAAFWQRRHPWAKTLAAVSAAVALLTVALYLVRSRPLGQATAIVAAADFSPLLKTLDEPPPPAAPDALAGELWFATPPRRVLSSLAISGTEVFFGTHEGTVESYDRATGAHRWTLRKREPVLAPPLVAGALLIVGEGLHTTARARLTAVDLAAATVAWEREFRGHLEQAPVYDPSTKRIYLCGGQSGVWALAAADGAPQWHAPLGHCDASPALGDDGTLYVNTQPTDSKKESALCALATLDGKTKWCRALPGQPWGQPLHAAGLLLVTTGLGQVGPLLPSDEGWAHGLDAATGAVRWTVKLPTMALLQGALTGGGKLFVLSLKRGTLMALDAATGRTRWETEVGHELRAPAVAYALAGREELAAASYEGKLSFIAAATGEELNTIDLSGETYAGPAFGRGVLYGASAGQLSALDLAAYRRKKPQ